MRKIFFWVSRERSVFCSGSKINIHLSRLFFLSTPSPVHIWVMSFPSRGRGGKRAHTPPPLFLSLFLPLNFVFMPLPSSSGSQEHGSFVQRPPALIFHCPLNMNYGLPPIPLLLPPPFALVAPGGGQTPVNKPAASTRRGEPCQVFFHRGERRNENYPIWIDR